MSSVDNSDGLVADNSLERATLTRKTSKRLQSQYSALSNSKNASAGSTIFWLAIGVLTTLALSNLALTFFAMGVLRLGAGMESMEFITGSRKMLNLFGNADLGILQQQDGVLSSFSGESMELVGNSGQVSIGVNTVRPSPAVHIAQNSVHIVNVNKLQINDPSTSDVIFSSERPNFSLPSGVKNLNVAKIQTPRLVSQTDYNFHVRADSSIKVRGNEGVQMKSQSLELNADQDIYLKSLNGSLILDGGNGGVFIEVNNLPLAGPVNHTKDRGQYKLCLCSKSKSSKVKRLTEGHLFRVPVPLDNIRRTKEYQINCASFTNPCI